MSMADLVSSQLFGAEYAADPVQWTHDKAGEETWSKQDEILQSLLVNRKTAVKSCHGPGKSHIASRAVAWWLESHPIGDAFVVSTAPSFPQVRAILWRYINQLHKKAGLRGRCNQTEWHMGGELVGYGRKPADLDESGFQGIHALRVLVVVDEACGIPVQLWNAVEALLTNDDCRVLALGNPDDPSSHFAKVCAPGSGWNVITISAFDTPNFTGEEVSPRLRRSLIGKAWVEDARKNWGEDSPLWVSKVLGEFPEDTEDGIIPSSRIASLRYGDPDPIDEDEEDVQLGVDVGAGGDRSVIYERRGNVVGRHWSSRHDDPMRLVGEVVSAIRETGARRVCIDVIGVGWGVKGRVEEVCQEDPDLRHVEVVGVNVGAASSEPKRFGNLKAEIWWEVGRGHTMDETWDLRGLDDQTVADLVAPKYRLDSRGRIFVESKDDVRERIGRSPDDADALLLAFYQGGGKSKIVLHKVPKTYRGARGSVARRQVRRA